MTHLSLTDAAVRDAAVTTSAQTGTTTTLDVKRQLRREGYWAVQADVSRRVRRLAARERWPWWGLGRFRLYGVPRPGQVGLGVAGRAALVN